MSYGKILVPTDFSAHSRLAIEHAHVLAERFGSRIELIHVWELPPIVPEVMVTLGGGRPTAVRDYLREQAQRDMEALLTDLRRTGMIVHGRTEQGDPARAVVELAERDRFDLIVMSTHGRRGFERLMLGSVAEKVIRRAPCPVFVVRPPAPAPGR
jgi:nucleotide-binding universal stress UspA family protein